MRFGPAWVSTPIGTLQRLSTSLRQIAWRMRGLASVGKAAGGDDRGERLKAGGDGAVELAEGEAVGAAGDLDDAGGDDGAGGPDDAADGAGRADGAVEDLVRIEAGKAAVVERATVGEEIPPGNAVGNEGDGGLGAEQGRDGGGDGGQGGGFHRHQHGVLRAEVLRVVARGRADVDLLG